jgi:hypothetical protein
MFWRAALWVIGVHVVVFVVVALAVLVMEV